MKALIDGDILVFKFAFRHQHKFEFGTAVDDKWIVFDDITSFIDSIKQQMEVDDILVCLTAFNNFRKDFKVAYKEHRKKQEKPKLLPTIRKFFLDNYPTAVWNRLEADDIMGILSTRYPGEYIIASTDKDLLQIPGKHFDWRNGELTEVTPEDGKRFFYSQILSGDPSDGYKGVPGIGKVKAKKLLEDAETEAEMWKIVVKAYEKKEMTAEDALNTARLAFILDNSHWDEEKKEVILWEPPAETVEAERGEG